MYGIRRIFNKLLHFFSKSSLLSGYMRARLQKLRGVNFDDVSTVFLGEDVIIDGICPENVTIKNGCQIGAGRKIVTHFYDNKKLSNHTDYHFRFYQGKVLIEENGYSLVKINNTACRTFKLSLWEFRSKLITSQNEINIE